MIKTDIESSITNFSQDNFLKNSLELFDVLGYVTKRQDKVSSIKDFETRFLLNALNEEKALFSEWKDAQFLFELLPDDLNSDETEITSEKVDNKDIQTYWFYGIELKGENYTKRQLSDITREINKTRSLPAFILFKYSDKLTLSIIDRRVNKRSSAKDVLEKIVLIKDIDVNKPHRAHIEILNDLSWENIKSKYNVTNFVGLHENWLKTLSVSELNKKFYTELSNWFFWMIDTCQLSIENKPKDNIMFGIRMITRIIFDWFIKEKGLVSDKVFDKQTYLDLLKPEYKGQGDLYYKVILQNLFFGCLSKPMDRREFVPDKRFQGKSTGYDVNNLFRYAKYLNNPQDVINMFKDIPFLNGGLFECTDDKRNGKYIDCFTDNDSKNFLKIPDDIFFMKEEKVVDLSEHFDGNRSYKNAKVKGLFTILNSYKFTIDETTPVEEEIALDPELLGRVFENLLAAHNPETKTTARKSTGSYYTPREIVDYMCEQSLINYLKTKVESLNIENLDDKLTELLSYSETHSFNENEVNELIRAVNEVKILDPACGSGAFPMGLLHKLVHVLSKLDPHNEKWKESQIDKASQIDDIEAREEAIKIIEEQFNDNEMDYSRKLYLIQNCIFGVDIQPMATQISRLRFFISLIVDEKTDKSKPNMGILALPNLETKFVAANTLIDLNENNLFAQAPKIVELKKKLEKVRDGFFRANTSQRKENLKTQDKKIREEIKQTALLSNFDFEQSAKLADWSPYDKDYSSGWFNPKWMFNVDKFDIVIGNPPYGENIKELKNYFKKSYNCTEGKYEIYKYFIEKGINLTIDNGVLAYITPNTWLNLGQFKKLREIISHNNIFQLTETLYNIFEAANVDTIVFLLKKEPNTNYLKLYKSNLIDSSIIECNYNNDFIFYESNKDELVLKIESNNTILLNNISEIWQGLIAYSSKDQPREYSSYTKDTEFHRKLLYGKDIFQYGINWGGEYLKYGEWLHRPRPSYIYDRPKLLVQRIRNPKLFKRLIVTLDKEKYINGTGMSNILINNNDYKIEYVLAILNSNCINYWFKNYFTDVNIKPEQLRKIPIKQINDTIQAKFVYIVEKIQNLTLTDDYLTNTDKQQAVAEYEEQIDLMVYKLYDLTYDEVKTIDSDFTMSEAEYNKYEI